MSNGSRLLLLGLKGSGKTSYLAALWHLIEARELPASLVAAELQPNREYLNRIRDSWLRFQQVGRTSLRLQEEFTLILKEMSTTKTINITLPDLSGESLRFQWALKKATKRYVEFAKQASGLLLFIHPDSVKRMPLIEAAKEEASSKPTGEQAVVQWSAELSPTQVQLVELLQIAYYLRIPNEVQRVSIIISAWDQITNAITPRSWLEKRLPLLFQFLRANEDRNPYQVYGVSALGGDLQQDLDKLRGLALPTARIRLVDDSSAEGHDLTIPLRFLLGLDVSKNTPTSER
jgi:hypothetical protein